MKNGGRSDNVFVFACAQEKAVHGKFDVAGLGDCLFVLAAHSSMQELIDCVLHEAEEAGNFIG